MPGQRDQGEDQDRAGQHLGAQAEATHDGRNPQPAIALAGVPGLEPAAEGEDRQEGIEGECQLVIGRHHLPGEKRNAGQDAGRQPAGAWPPGAPAEGERRPDDEPPAPQMEELGQRLVAQQQAQEIEHLEGEGEVGVGEPGDEVDAAVVEIDLRDGEMIDEAVVVNVGGRGQSADQGKGPGGKQEQQEWKEGPVQALG